MFQMPTKGSRVLRLFSKAKMAVVARSLAAPRSPGVTPGLDAGDHSFYEALGIAVAQWQHVEEQLCNLYLWTSATDHLQLASAVFYATSDFFHKLQITDASVRNANTLSPEFISSWDSLRVRLLREWEAFNSLIHFTIVFENQKVSSKDGLKLKSNYSRPSTFSRRRKAMAAGTVLDRQGLDRIANGFVELQVALLGLSQSIQPPIDVA